MPEISFYVLSSQSVQEKYLFACKLIEKAYRSGHFGYVFTDCSEQSQLLDALLWTFRPGSFIPHQIYSGVEPDYENTVLIGSLNAPEHWKKTQINLASHCPQDYQHADRILEILDNSEESKTLGRNRYRQYQQAGIKPIYHDMGKSRDN